MLHLKPLAAWILLLPLGIITWALFLESGIHATISGVVLGFLVPVKMSARSEAAQAEHGLAEVLEHRFRPLSTGICVPVFAFFSAGVLLAALKALGRALTDSVAVGIMVALVAGKTIGIFGTTWIVTRFKNANLDPDVAWIDVVYWLQPAVSASPYPYWWLSCPSRTAPRTPRMQRLRFSSVPCSPRLSVPSSFHAVTSTTVPWLRRKAWTLTTTASPTSSRAPTVTRRPKPSKNS